ncbi:MAG: outer membrane beta-barrel protein [Bacteroidaceae bacterium]|nr:outer membrane beta-barrel protein [Bacteroidaceae bacterium]
MKKIILVSLLLMVSLVGFAQKGRHAVGVDVAMKAYDAGHDEIFGMFGGLFFGVKYQYNFHDYFRVEPSYQRKQDDKAGYTDIFGVNLHGFFMSPRPFRPYAFIGVGGGQAEYDLPDATYNKYDETEFYMQAGVGVDWRIGYRLSWQLEVGGNISIAPIISTGLTYGF